MISRIIVLILGLILGFMIGYIVFGQSAASSVYTVEEGKCFIDEIIIPGDKDKILQLIYSAKDSIYIEMYILSDDEIISGIERAYYSGVDVKIILEEEVDYNNNAFMNLVSKGIDVKWSGDAYKLTHSKLMIIDNKTVLLGSPNFTYSGLSLNREVGIITNCSVEPYLEVFMEDWNR